MHAISIVDYDDATQSWIIRNSWGEIGGEGGFSRVAYDDDSGVADSTWLFMVPAVAGSVSTVSPRDYSYITGDALFSGQSNFGKTAGFVFQLYDKNNRQVFITQCSPVPCQTMVPTHNTADGRYEVETLAIDDTGAPLGKSTREFLYVVNSDPQMTLAFKGRGNLDLTKPLKGRVELQISSTSIPVPMSSLEFHIKSLATGRTTIKKSEVVLNTMTLGWRTNLVPNGEYEIWMVGRVDSNGKSALVESPRVKVKTQIREIRRSMPPWDSEGNA